MSGFTRTTTTFTVRITAHHVPPRFDIPETERTLYAPSAGEALNEAVRIVAREYGCHLWKPWLRTIREHAEIVASNVEEVKLG